MQIVARARYLMRRYPVPVTIRKTGSREGDAERKDHWETSTERCRWDGLTVANNKQRMSQ
jgi:hypothetical protein